MTRFFIALLEVLFLPIYAMIWLTEKLSGEGRWYQEQKKRMVEERPALSDDDFVEQLGLTGGDVRLGLAVRRAMAESCGLPSEAIYPDDRLADLWRMQWLGPDFLDLVMRIEDELETKIVADDRLDEVFTDLCYDKAVTEFRQFATVIVEALRSHFATVED